MHPIDETKIKEARALVNWRINYKAACRAIATCARTDLLKEVVDEAVAMRAYAKQAKNHKLEADCIGMRMPAARQLDLLRQRQKTTVGLARGGEHGGRRRKDGLRRNPSNPRATLAMQGIDKNLAHQARRLGALSERDFENHVIEEREKVLRASGALAAKPAAPDAIARCVEIVKRAVAHAAKKVPREQVLKALWNEIGLPEDCGPGSASEMARINAYNEELVNRVRLLESKIRAIRKS